MHCQNKQDCNTLHRLRASKLNIENNAKMMQRILLAAIVVLATFAYASAETTCQSHKRNSGTTDHGVGWDITCDGEGYYVPLQCNNEPKEKKRWCACYNKEEAITSPSRKTRTCVCPLDADEAQRNSNNADDCSVPQCENTGKYKTKQCCASTRKCHCVDPDTGAATTQPKTGDVQCPA